MAWRRSLELFVGVALALLAFAPCFAHAQTAPAEAARFHYEAFSAAYQAGDLAAAEGALRSALDAHAEADMDDPSRAVLLLNLALVLVEGRQGVAAQGTLDQLNGLPAETYAESAALAAVLRAGADYWSDNASGAALMAALEAAPLGQPMLSRQALVLAQALAEQTQSARDFALAGRAWAATARFSEAGGAQGPLIQGRSLVGEGVALLFSGQDAAALAAFTQAMETLAPFAAEGRGGAVTSGEAAYAEALAWRGAARAKMVSAGMDLAGFPDPRVQPAPLPDAPAVCPLRINADPPPETPLLRGGRVSVGAVVVAISLDTSGRPTATEVAAFAPDPALAESVRRVLPRWRFETNAAAAPGCRVERFRELRLIVLRGENGSRN
jgi:hypothetical protein